ncbi:TRZ/ATZ family hydrolase [Chitinimonas sp.]|uniref:TRZ/ATZ family hydrolase n=1 Tax=Chitinimonas sp. TaxID=1934313 RepID=UPI002F94AF14
MAAIHCLHPRWLIPIEPRGLVLEQHALVLQGSQIIDLLPSEAARQRYQDAAHQVLGDHALLPGLINLHAHSAMSLLRGLADDLALMDWLNNHIWPAEARHVSDEFVYDGTLHAMAEMLRGGTTTVNDMYFHHEAVARAGLTAGMRVVVGCSILEFPTAYGLHADDYLGKALTARDAFHGESLVGFSLAPHAPYTVTDATFGKVLTMAEQLDMGIHCHIHETRDEIEGSLKEYGMRPLARLQALGLLGPNLVAAHVVHANDAEIALLAKYGVHVAHNPASNLKLASGFARIHAMQQAGINVGIGTDGAASNNRLDLLGDTRMAALLAKAESANPTALDAATALEMATLAGARALGLADRIGSLVVGKQADVIAIDLAALETQPVFDPLSTLIYAAQREQVSHAWVAGKQLLKERELTTLKLDQMQAKARWWQSRIAVGRSDTTS